MNTEKNRKILILATGGVVALVLLVLLFRPQIQSFIQNRGSADTHERIYTEEELKQDPAYMWYNGFHSGCVLSIMMYEPYRDLGDCNITVSMLYYGNGVDSIPMHEQVKVGAMTWPPATQDELIEQGKLPPQR